MKALLECFFPAMYALKRDKVAFNGSFRLRFWSRLAESAQTTLQRLCSDLAR